MDILPVFRELFHSDRWTARWGGGGGGGGGGRIEENLRLFSQGGVCAQKLI